MILWQHAVACLDIIVRRRSNIREFLILRVTDLAHLHYGTLAICKMVGKNSLAGSPVGSYLLTGMSFPLRYDAANSKSAIMSIMTLGRVISLSPNSGNTKR